MLFKRATRNCGFLFLLAIYYKIILNMELTEKQILSAIHKVLMENRKVLKIGGQQMPPMDPSMSAAPADPSMGGDPNAMGGAPEPSMGGDPNAMGGEPMDSSMGGDENQFDTNFDAGVEADEETDPKRYIQQLTGKLSQSLNSFNNEQGPDAGLSKYVASMIIAAAAKNLDEKAKKELIEKINSASSDDDVDGEDMGGDEMPEEQPMDSQEQMPMNEDVNYSVANKIKRIIKGEIDYLYNEGVIDYNDDNILSIANGEKEPDYQDIINAAIYDHKSNPSFSDVVSFLERYEPGNKAIENTIKQAFKEYSKNAVPAYMRGGLGLYESRIITKRQLKELADIARNDDKNRTPDVSRTGKIDIKGPWAPKNFTK